MKIILEQRIPDPSVPYAFKNIIVEGDETDPLVDTLEKKTLEWREAIQKQKA